MREEEMPAPPDGRLSQSQVQVQSTAGSRGRNNIRYGCAFTVNMKAQYWKVAVGWCPLPSKPWVCT